MELFLYVCALVIFEEGYWHALHRPENGSPAISVAPETKLKEVVNVMAEHNISGVPVIDAKAKWLVLLVKQISSNMPGRPRQFVLSALRVGFAPMGEITEEAWCIGRVLNCWPVPPKPLWLKVITVRGDASGLEIARIMSRRKINRVPVVDGDGRLLGLFPGADLVRSFAERGEK